MLQFLSSGFYVPGCYCNELKIDNRTCSATAIRIPPRCSQVTDREQMCRRKARQEHEHEHKAAYQHKMNENLKADNHGLEKA